MHHRVDDVVNPQAKGVVGRIDREQTVGGPLPIFREIRVVVGEDHDPLRRIVVLEDGAVVRYHVDERMGNLDVVDPEEAPKDGMGIVDVDPAVFGQRPLYLSSHVVPLLTLEVVENEEASLQEKGPEVLGSLLRHGPRTPVPTYRESGAGRSSDPRGRGRCCRRCSVVCQ